MAKNDFDNFLDGLEVGIKVLGAVAIAGSQIHQALSVFREEEEEAIAPQPSQKQLPPARRRRKSNG